MGSPTKRQKTVMCDERYQRLIAKAQRDWAAGPPVLDEAYNAVQDFLFPESGEDTTVLGGDDNNGLDLGDPTEFDYGQPEAQVGPDQSDRETLCVLRVLKEKGELDMDPLLTEVKLKATELG